MRLLLCIFIGFVCAFEHAKSSTCENKMCPGPKFTQSVCCPGFVCVSTSWSRSPNHLVCVNQEKRLRIFSLNEILERAEKSMNKGRAHGGNQNLPQFNGFDNNQQHNDYSGSKGLSSSKKKADISARSDLENDSNSAAYDEVDVVPIKVKRIKHKLPIKSNKKKIELKHHKNRKKEGVIEIVNRANMPTLLRHSKGDGLKKTPHNISSTNKVGERIKLEEHKDTQGKRISGTKTPTFFNSEVKKPQQPNKSKKMEDIMKMVRRNKMPTFIENLDENDFKKTPANHDNSSKTIRKIKPEISATKTPTFFNSVVEKPRQPNKRKKIEDIMKMVKRNKMPTFMENLDENDFRKTPANHDNSSKTIRKITPEISAIKTSTILSSVVKKPQQHLSHIDKKKEDIMKKVRRPNMPTFRENLNKNDLKKTPLNISSLSKVGERIKPEEHKDTQGKKMSATKTPTFSNSVVEKPLQPNKREKIEDIMKMVRRNKMPTFMENLDENDFKKTPANHDISSKTIRKIKPEISAIQTSRTLGSVVNKPQQPLSHKDKREEVMMKIGKRSKLPYFFENPNENGFKKPFEIAGTEKRKINQEDYKNNLSTKSSTDKKPTVLDSVYRKPGPSIRVTGQPSHYIIVSDNTSNNSKKPSGSIKLNSLHNGLGVEASQQSNHEVSKVDDEKNNKNNMLNLEYLKRLQRNKSSIFRKKNKRPQ